jgi:hypothetical protein
MRGDREAVTQATNNPPDVTLELTHEQATFMLENCLANNRMCLALVMSIADEDLTQGEKMEKAQKITDMQDKFRDIMKLLRRAGAREKED